MDARTLVVVAGGVTGRSRLTDRSLESVARIVSPQVDVLVFGEGDGDDGTGARDGGQPTGLTFYRSPRRLGPARTLNVAFLHALSAGYDAVLACEPHVTVPTGVVAALSEMAANGRIASVAAWSTAGLEQDIVDWIPTALAGDRPPAVEVGSSAGPCVLFTAAALRDVGLFDPIYVAGDDHHIDWVQRATGLGYRCVAAPAVHVSGSRSTPTRPSALIGFRHPAYRDAPTPDAAPMAAVVIAAARRFGYTLEVGWPDVSGADGEDTAEVHVYVEPDGDKPVVSGHFCGFSASLPVERGGDLGKVLAELLGGEPRDVIVSEKGSYATLLAGGAPFMYPKRV